MNMGLVYSSPYSYLAASSLAFLFSSSCFLSSSIAASLAAFLSESSDVYYVS